jgi:hypothetical protein
MITRDVAKAAKQHNWCGYRQPYMNIETGTSENSATMFMIREHKLRM